MKREKFCSVLLFLLFFYIFFFLRSKKEKRKKKNKGTLLITRWRESVTYLDQRKTPSLRERVGGAGGAGSRGGLKGGQNTTFFFSNEPCFFLFLFLFWGRGREEGGRPGCGWKT